MQTAGGQAVSGASGAAGEQAQLLASRTGNTAAVPGIIDATARNAMKQQSNNALNIADQNAQLKLKQQQEGAAGLEGLYGTDTSAALRSLGLADESINAWTGAKHAANSDMWGGINNIRNLIPSSSSSGGGGSDS